MNRTRTTSVTAHHSTTPTFTQKTTRLCVCRNNVKWHSSRTLRILVSIQCTGRTSSIKGGVHEKRNARLLQRTSKRVDLMRSVTTRCRLLASPTVRTGLRRNAGMQMEHTAREEASCRPQSQHQSSRATTEALVSSSTAKKNPTKEPSSSIKHQAQVMAPLQAR